MSTAVQPAPIPFAPSASQLAIAYSVCRGITRASAKNFYYAFLVLPRPKRRALCAVYAYMRRCDDIADDESISFEERRQKLSTWVHAVHGAVSGHATEDPVLLALTDAQRRYGIPLQLLDELAKGTAMDVAERPGYIDAPYKTFEDLRLYCYRVASVVGLVCIRIFGYKDPAAEALAEQVGLAFQLTNIIRDIKEDTLAGRVYLPVEDLTKFGISVADLTAASDASHYAPLLAMEADRAREYYKAGEELIPLIDEDSQPALWALVTIYRSLLDKIAAQQYDVFHGKVSLTVREKLKILAQGFFKRLL
jgi:phytoene synthase